MSAEGLQTDEVRALWGHAVVTQAKMLQGVQGPSHVAAHTTGTAQIDSALLSPNTPEAPANPAGQTDASIAPSQDTNHTNHTAGQATTATWTASSVTVPVRTRSRRKSSRGKGTMSKDKPASIVGSSEGKQSAKRRKISFFERITFICTSCVTSSPRTHDVELDESASHKDKETHSSEKQSTREGEGAAEHPTREPSASSTSE